MKNGRRPPQSALWLCVVMSMCMPVAATAQQQTSEPSKLDKLKAKFAKAKETVKELRGDKAELQGAGSGAGAAPGAGGANTGGAGAGGAPAGGAPAGAPAGAAGASGQASGRVVEDNMQIIRADRCSFTQVQELTCYLTMQRKGTDAKVGFHPRTTTMVDSLGSTYVLAKGSIGANAQPHGVAAAGVNTPIQLMFKPVDSRATSVARLVMNGATFANVPITTGGGMAATDTTSQKAKSAGSKIFDKLEQKVFGSPAPAPAPAPSSAGTQVKR